jgi:hypothetical protein
MTNQIESRRENIKALIESAGSTFIGVDFIKADGSLRTMNVQTHAGHSLLKGDDASESAKSALITRKANNPHLMPVFDVANNAWRSINLDTVQRITIRGTTFTIKENA